MWAGSLLESSMGVLLKGGRPGFFGNPEVKERLNVAQ
jgi:hypothetical protein